MASNDNASSLSINRLTSDTSSMVKHTESTIQAPSSSTIIPLTCDSSTSTFRGRLSKKIHSIDNSHGFHYVSTLKQTKMKETPTNYLRYRLCRREYFIARLTLVSNLMTFLAIFSITLMIIENEFTFRYVDNQDTKVSWFLKLIITITTVILLALILYYYYLDMSSYAFRNRIDNWHVELTVNKILWIIAELVICAIHPVPRAYPYVEPERINFNSTGSDLSSLNSYSESYISLDVALGLPMFFRLYLLGRSIILHAHSVRNITLRSLGYLNHVSIDFFFLIKSYLDHWPIRCLISFCTVVFFIGSWSLHACDYKTTKEHLSMSDAMWLFVITFTTVGYGDIYPSTYCGRSVAAIISLIGLLLSAFIIAILTTKLRLTREEKYVYTFGLNTLLSRDRIYQAANIIKFAMKTWHLKGHNKSSFIKYFRAQQKLFRSIHTLQQIRQEQRSLMDSCVGFPELINSQRNIHVQTEETIDQIVAIKTDVKEIKDELNNLHCTIHTLQNTMNILLKKATEGQTECKLAVL